MNATSVLLVDDSPIFLRLAADFLQRYGQNEVVVIGAASRGEEALTQAQTLRPQVILLDLNMPGLSGLEAIPLLRKALPDTGIVALTLLDVDEYRQAALIAGADEFVSKGNLNTDLLPAIRRTTQKNSRPR